MTMMINVLGGVANVAANISNGYALGKFFKENRPWQWATLIGIDSAIKIAAWRALHYFFQGSSNELTKQGQLLFLTVAFLSPCLSLAIVYRQVKSSEYIKLAGYSACVWRINQMTKVGLSIIFPGLIRNQD